MKSENLFVNESENAQEENKCCQNSVLKSLTP